MPAFRPGVVAIHGTWTSIGVGAITTISEAAVVEGTAVVVTGASVTSRAVVNAVDLTLRYFEVNRDRVFATRAVAGSEHE